MASLVITVESSRRAGIVDTVKPVIELPFKPDELVPEILATDRPYQLRLSNGDTVEVACARGVRGELSFAIKSADGQRISFDSSDIHRVEATLSDGLEYQFHIQGNFE